ARCRPRRLGLRRLDHPPLLLLRPQPLPSRFGAAQHRRGRQPHSRKTLQHIFRRVRKRQQRPRQADQRHQPRTDLVHQAQRVVVRKEALLAPAAVVVGPPNLHDAMHRHHWPLLVGVELCRILTVRAGQAAPDVPLFFRLATLACRTSLVSFSPASRNSKSMAPNSSASGTSTARSTIWRTVASTFGRSSFMMASMRCSRVSSVAAGRERAAMISSLLKNRYGFPAPAPNYQAT